MMDQEIAGILLDLDETIHSREAAFWTWLESEARSVGVSLGVAALKPDGKNQMESAMTFGPLLDLRPSLDSGEFRALLLLLVGWRDEQELDQHRLDRVIQGYRSSPHVHVLGFQSGGGPIAMIALAVESPHWGVIHQIVVHPEWRGQGLGRALIEGAQAQLGLASISAETGRNAVGFYARNGFRVASLGEKYPGVERFFCRN